MTNAPPTSAVEDVAATGSHSPVRHWLSPLLSAPTPIIFLVASAVAVFLLWRQGSLGDIGTTIGEAHPAKLAAILIVYAASILILGYRWHVLVRLAGGLPVWGSSAEVFLTSVMVNYAAPIGLAVPTRAALTVRDLGLAPVQSGAVVGWELGLDVAALLLISLAWLTQGGSALLSSTTMDRGVMAALTAIVTVAFIGLIVASRVTTVRSRAVRVLAPMLANPVRQPGLAFLAIGLTAVYWLIQIGVMSAFLDVFGVDFSLSLVLGLMGLPVLIGMLSPVPGGAGVREALMAAMARLEGVPAAPVILAAVSYRLALFAVTPIVWGVLRLARAPLKRAS